MVVSRVVHRAENHGAAPSWSLKEPELVASVLGADYARLGDEVASFTDAGLTASSRTSWTDASSRT